VAEDERLEMEGLPTDDTMRSDSDATPLDKQLVKAALFPRRASPARIGRYTVLGQIGRGGMGIVYAGYDDLLDRKIAVKVLHGERTVAARLRLLREAQALARLNHPNVVSIHDVGLIGEQVYLAMEFIDGQTFGAWRRAAPRSWREVLAVVLAAGEGLAAAHAKGLVHRDVKPDNIMVGADGRVRVMDFGLARTDDPAGERPELAGVLRGENALSVELTMSDAVLGTPAYMSPEQLLGAGTDARTDQFCLCMTAWEALYDQRAFSGDNFSELARRVIRGELTPPPAGRDVPAWLRRVLERGLRSAVGERYPDTPALLSALRADPTRRRRMVVGALSLVVAIAGGFGARHYLESRQVAACAAEGASIAEVWNDDVQRGLRAGLRASGVTYAETTAERVSPYFTAQADAWREARTEACLDARVRETTSEALHEQAAWCLDERRLEMAALIAELSRASATTAAKAVPAAAGLSRIDQCRDEHRLERLPPLPQDRAGVQSVRERLSRVDALRAAGSYDDALAAAGEALAAAEATGWPPLVVAARLRRGHLLGLTGKYAEAGVALEDAYFQAVEVGALELAATATAMLVYTVGYKQARHDEGRRWWRQAEVTLNVLGVGADDLRREEPLSHFALVHDAMGAYEQAKALHERALAIREQTLGRDHPAVADSLHNLGSVFNTIGAFEQAQQCQERALAIRERAFGPDHPVIAGSYNNLAAVQFSLGAYAEAGRLFRRALAVAEAAHGPDHPAVADFASNVANAYYMSGDYGSARPLYERAIAIQEKALGPEHPGLADPLNNFGNVLDATGDHAGAKAMYERALAIREKALGPEHPFVAESLSSLASVYTATGAYAQARAYNLRALAIREKALGPEHASVGESLHNLANVDFATGAHADARARYERALAIHEKAVGPDHPDVAYHLAGLAEVALAQGEPGDALAPAERAVKVRSDAAVPPELLAYARFLLAKALWGAPGGDRGRALALARQAHEAFRAAEGQDKLRAEAEAWVRDHGGEP
jgi:tetratricopeptide (TPR) repeat protein/predicted Ser/Thr protein kinase